MDPDRWKQIDNLLHSALEHPAAERDAFLRSACASDETLESEVRSLLAARQEAGFFLENPAIEVAAQELAMEKIQGAEKRIESHAPMFSSGRVVNGRFEILNFVGMGGMGEVYRARDLALGRTVALKFVRELAQEAAAGLEHAHQHGISHRDLKPPNFMLTGTGLKILDFGLAKIRTKSNSSSAGGDAHLTTTRTQPGSITGTPAYMAPEQVRGEPADERSDIFSFGVIVYEMLSGGRPFTGASIQEAFAAILTSMPRPIAKRHLNPILERIVCRCLEKDPGQRFQHASDLRFPLELAATVPHQLEAEHRTPVQKRRWFWAVITGLCCLTLLIAMQAFWGSKPEQTFTFHQVTFRRGSIDTARFASGRQTIIYDAAWEGRASDIFECQLQTPEARALGFPNSYLASVTGSGELMILQLHRPVSTRPFQATGTLARVAATGGSPREILDNVYAADSSPDAKALAAMQLDGSTLTMQYPLGSALCKIPLDYEPKFRLAPDGQMLAITGRDDGRPYISLFRKDSRAPSSIAEGYSVRSLAWISPRELVFPVTDLVKMISGCL